MTLTLTTNHIIIFIGLLLSLGVAQENETTIILGPIIGKVTNSTARILFEFNRDAVITVTISDPSGAQINTTRNVTGWVAIPFAFQGLLPDTRYTVSLNSTVTNMTVSYFTTIGGPSGNLNFGVVSCMDRSFQYTKTTNADLWADMSRRVQNGEIQYLIHTGDQIYTDNLLGEANAAKPYYACSKIFNETARDQWDSRRAECLEMIRHEYRTTWSIPSVRETLSKVPSLMIFDDHEVRDDWGYLTQDYDPNSQDYYYGLIARQAYYEYQRQLREDIDFSNYSNMTAEYYYETLNGIGFFFLDYRGIRTWNRNFSQMNNMQLGINQTQLLQQVLEPTAGIFAEAKSFFLVSPLTVVFLVEALVKIGYFAENDAQESWSYAYLDEQEQLLNLLKDWKQGRDGREVTILDGDVHMGGYTNIKYGREEEFVQFTCSSMASSAPSDAAFMGFDLVKELQTLVDRWEYEHHDWTNEYNYGIVIARSRDNEAEVERFLVKATDEDDPEIMDSKGRDVDDSDWLEIWSSY